MVSMIIAQCEVTAILGNGFGIAGKKLFCMASGKQNASRVSLQEFDIRYIVF